MVRTFAVKTWQSTSFKEGRSGRAFMRGSGKRNRAGLKVCILEYREAKRHAAVNAETLTSHIGEIKRIIEL